MEDYKKNKKIEDTNVNSLENKIDVKNIKWKFTKDYLDYNGIKMSYTKINNIRYDKYKNSSATFQYKGEKYILYRYPGLSEQMYENILNMLKGKKQEKKLENKKREDEIKKRKKEEEIQQKTVIYTFVITVVILISIIVGCKIQYISKDNGNNISNKTIECSVCHREFNLDSENAKNIRKTNMCNQCFKNYEYSDEYIKELPINE